MTMEKKRGTGRTLKGIVSSNKMAKTATVVVTSTVRHPTYSKTIKRSKKYHAHDEKNQCEIGDVVVIKEAAPYSKTKNWCVAKILETQKS